MDRLIAFLSAPIPRPILWIGVPILALLLVISFVFLRFPFGEFSPTLARQISQATGGEVFIGDIESKWTWAGPGMAARDVRIVMPTRSRIDIDPLSVRPAWSTSWLWGEPALKVVAQSTIGSLDGIVEIGDLTSWSGEFTEVDLAQLPLPATEGFAVEGILNGAADLILAPDGAYGPLSFDAVSGQLNHSALPIGVEFDLVSADLLLDGPNLVEIRRLEFTGPIIEVSASGNVLPGGPQQEPRLDLGVDLEIKNPPLRTMMQGMGLPIGQTGRASFSLQGTPSDPRLE